MGRRARLCATVVVVASSLLWLLLVVGTAPSSAQADRGAAVSVQVAVTVSPSAMPTKGQPAQQGKPVQTEQVPFWVTLSVLLISCSVLLAVLGFMLWIGGLLPWHRQSQLAGWRYEVLLALLAALAAVVSLAPQFFAVFTPPIWVRIVFLALAFVLVLALSVMSLWSTQQEKERSWARQVRGLLKELPGTDGRLPRLSSLSPYRLGISPSRYGSEEQRGNDPYVSRVIDDVLDQALRSKRFILVVGDSKAGKSRTAYEAATRLRHSELLQDPRVLVVKSADHLGQLLDLDPPLDLRPEPALLWLDDLTESELAALTPALLDRLTAQLIVLGTLTAQRHNRVRESDSDISRNARLALQRATVIRLDAGLTNKERAEAEQKYPEERFEAGIGEQLVAVDQLTSRYDDAREGANPHGWAVVQAAIDWTRMDVGRPIRQHELVTLCPLYLKQLRAHARHDDKEHEEALRWACQPVSSHIALLEELPGSDLDESSYAPFDYLVAAADGQDGRLPQPILDPAWDKVLALASPSEAVNAGVSASFRQLLLRAQKIFTTVADGNSEATPVATFNLGLLLNEQGDLEGAKAAYQRAVASGDSEAAPRAVAFLGELLKMQGDLEGAKAAYQHAIASGHAEAAPRAAFDLGELLKEQGDLEGAKAAYQRAIDSGHADQAPTAAVVLGNLLREQGDLARAKTFYQRAINSGYADAAPWAAFNLGVLLQEQRDLAGAKAAYQQAIASGHAEMAPRGALGLGALLKEQGDLAGAKAAYQQAISSGDAEIAPKAAFNLGTLLEKEGNLAGAKAAYQQAIVSGNAEAAPAAANLLGYLLEREGDLAGAKAAYQQAIVSGNADQAPTAAFILGNLLREQGDLAGAKAAYQQAIDSGHAEMAPTAAVNLGVLLQEHGDFRGAKAAWQQAIDSGHTEMAPMAAVNLGVLLQEHGDLQGT